MAAPLRHLDVRFEGIVGVPFHALEIGGHQRGGDIASALTIDALRELDGTTPAGSPEADAQLLTDATADLTFALLLAAARKLPEAMAAVAQGDWVTWEPGRYLGAAVQGQLGSVQRRLVAVQHEQRAGA